MILRPIFQPILRPVLRSMLDRPRKGGGTPAAGITPRLTVGYVDTDGVRHWDEVVDGATTITGMAPFLVDFFAGDSRSIAPDATDDVGAYWNLGYRMDYGESLGGTWPISGHHRDHDDGQPMFARAYTQPGTHTATLHVADSEGRQSSISLTVVVQAPPAEGVLMTSGVIPDFQNDTVYDAPAGGTWGDIGHQLNGKRNVVVRKVGEGADPVFDGVSFDGRNSPDEQITRSAGIRFWNCNVGRVRSGDVGYDYCGVVGGRCTGVDLPPYAYAWSEIFAQGRTQQQAENIRYLRGLFLWDCGELNEDQWTGYIIVGSARGVHIVGASLAKRSGADQHLVRGAQAYSTHRHSRLATFVSAVSYYKLQGESCTAGNGLPDAWREDDRVGDYATERYFGVPLHAVAVQNIVMGDAGDTQPVANAGAGAENNTSGEPAQGCELSGFEDCVYDGRTTQWYSIDLTGRGLGRRNVRLDGGAGAEINVSTTVQPNRVPGGAGGPWDGPYITTGSRPVIPPG